MIVKLVTGQINVTLVDFTQGNFTHIEKNKWSKTSKLNHN